MEVKKKPTLKIAWLLLIFLLGVSGNAIGTTIDFEGGTQFQLIQDFYAAEGVIFDDSWDFLTDPPYYAANSGIYTARTVSTNATISFLNPVSDVGAYFNVYAFPLTWTAYNSSDQALGSLTIPYTPQPNPSGIQPYGLPYDNISYVVFTASNTYFWNLDDLSFTPSDIVPEPATMLLFGFGLLGLAGVGRRKK